MPFSSDLALTSPLSQANLLAWTKYSVGLPVSLGSGQVNATTYLPYTGFPFRSVSLIDGWVGSFCPIVIS